MSIYKTYLVDEQHARDQLCDTLVDIFAHNLVNLRSQLFRNFGLPRFHQLSHHTHDVLSALWSCICSVQVMEGNVLNDLLLFMHVAFWHRHILLGLKVELGGICIASTDSLDSASVRLDIYDIPDAHSLFLYGLKNAGVQSQFFGSFGGFQSDEKV